ncbi:hypothetical protein KZX46_18890 [Polymorphobacter sp. PAMC 29334]|uniref:hypothetical protein n=1 Tax=Polymorphobacter sp. PAMC 29334 TaxID=2862331 RepID=UPI001C77E1DB|nr:hypothetical protein [Polymorphobacter sp. PAMC 29334]QYE34782.1 hypothetical protein KZX46_18890 [Polymorphobacter sp. PAMC 29334]
MQFKSRNLRLIAEMVVGNENHKWFHYRTSQYITRFFEECELEYFHDGSSRVPWTEAVLAELLNDSLPGANQLPERFALVLRTLMDKREAQTGDDGRILALAALNVPLNREGFEGYYGEDSIFYVRHTETKTVSVTVNLYRPLTPAEVEKRELLIVYLDKCSEDELIEEVLLPTFRYLGYQRITSVGHKDKALEYGKDLWMRYKMPTEHVIYFGIQAKKGKLDAAGASKGTNANMAEIYNQVLMMLGHEVFDSDTNKKALVDHAFIVAGGEITKAARNWLGGVLDKSQRSQIMFMDRDHILNLYIAYRLEVPKKAKLPKTNYPWSLDDDADVPF